MRGARLLWSVVFGLRLSIRGISTVDHVFESLENTNQLQRGGCATNWF